MRHGEHGRAQPSEQFLQFDDQPLPQRPVELPQRLVQHQQPGARREGPGQRHALLLPAGQRGDGPAARARQPHEVQQLLHPLGLSPLRLAVHPQPEGHVAAHVTLREQLVVLEHQPDPAPVRRQARLVAPVEQHPPGVQGLQPGHRPQQGRLAAAAGSEHAHDLVLGDLQIDGVQHGPAAEADRRVPQGQQHQNSPVRSVRSLSSTSRATAHTTIRIVERAIAWP